eukprot:2984681-Amphidinium_carterae.1
MDPLPNPAHLTGRRDTGSTRHRHRRDACNNAAQTEVDEPTHTRTWQEGRSTARTIGFMLQGLTLCLAFVHARVAFTCSLVQADPIQLHAQGLYADVIYVVSLSSTLSTEAQHEVMQTLAPHIARTATPTRKQHLEPGQFAHNRPLQRERLQTLLISTSESTCARDPQLATVSASAEPAHVRLVTSSITEGVAAFGHTVNPASFLRRRTSSKTTMLGSTCRLL